MAQYKANYFSIRPSMMIKIKCFMHPRRDSIKMMNLRPVKSKTKTYLTGQFNERIKRKNFNYCF